MSIESTVIIQPIFFFPPLRRSLFTSLNLNDNGNDDDFNDPEIDFDQGIWDVYPNGLPAALPVYEDYPDKTYKRPSMDSDADAPNNVPNANGKRSGSSTNQERTGRGAHKRRSKQRSAKAHKDKEGYSEVDIITIEAAQNVSNSGWMGKAPPLHIQDFLTRSWLTGTIANVIAEYTDVGFRAM